MLRNFLIPSALPYIVEPMLRPARWILLSVCATLFSQTLPPGFVNRAPQDLEAWTDFFYFHAKLMDDADAVRGQGGATYQNRVATGAATAKMSEALFVKTGALTQAAVATYKTAASARTAQAAPTGKPLSTSAAVQSWVERKMITSSAIETIRKKLAPEEWTQFEAAFLARQKSKPLAEEVK